MLNNLKILYTDCIGRAQIVECPIHGEVEVEQLPQKMNVKSKPFSSSCRVFGNQAPGYLDCGCEISPKDSFVDEEEIKERATKVNLILERVNEIVRYECTYCDTHHSECYKCAFDQKILKPFFSIIDEDRYFDTIGNDIEDHNITPKELKLICDAIPVLKKEVF